MRGNDIESLRRNLLIVAQFKIASRCFDCFAFLPFASTYDAEIFISDTAINNNNLYYRNQVLRQIDILFKDNKLNTRHITSVIM